MTVSASSVTLQGGSGPGAYAALVSKGDITVNTPTLALRGGKGLDSDAVVLSYSGIVGFPQACEGCVKLSSSSLGNNLTETGIMSGADMSALLGASRLQILNVISDLDGRLATFLTLLIKEADAQSDEKKKSKTTVVSDLNCKAN